MVGGSARQLDVTNAEEWQAVAKWIEAEAGRLDILVNSAGVALKDSVGDASLDIYQKSFAINVEGTLLGMAVALDFMRRQGKGAWMVGDGAPPPEDPEGLEEAEKLEDAEGLDDAHNLFALA